MLKLRSNGRASALPLASVLKRFDQVVYQLDQHCKDGEDLGDDFKLGSGVIAFLYPPHAFLTALLPDGESLYPA